MDLITRRMSALSTTWSIKWGTAGPHIISSLPTLLAVLRKIGKIPLLITQLPPQLVVFIMMQHEPKFSFFSLAYRSSFQSLSRQLHH